jgi:hypothetical protein
VSKIIKQSMVLLYMFLSMVLLVPAFIIAWFFQYIFGFGIRIVDKISNLFKRNESK